MLCFGLLTAAAVSLPDWLPTVSARLEGAQAHVGDAVGLHVTAIHRQDVSVSVPTHPHLGKLTVLGISQEQKDLKDGRKQTDFVLRVAAYELGDHEVPPLEVVAVGPDRRIHAIATEPLSLSIKSLLANVPDPRPKPPAPPVRVMERDFRLLWVGGAIAATALIVAGTLWLRRRLAARARRRPPPPPEPPHAIALRRLAELRASGLLERGDLDAYYERLSLAVRDYVGGRFGFDALDMTTFEIGEALAHTQASANPSEVGGFLSGCDLVKFARHRPGAEAAREALEEAVSLVERTKAVEASVAV